jgi:hypothetical protein
MGDATPNGGPASCPTPAEEKPLPLLFAEAFNAIAKATFIAAGVVVLGMVILWVRSGESGEWDRPGRYWLAVVPMVTFGWVLSFQADRWKDEPRRTEP